MKNEINRIEEICGMLSIGWANVYTAKKLMREGGKSNDVIWELETILKILGDYINDRQEDLTELKEKFDL